MMGSHQQAVNIRFTLWNVAVFHALLCKFIRSFTYYTDIYCLLFMCYTLYHGIQDGQNLWILGQGISINSSSNQQVHADGDVGQGETVLDPTSELRFTWKPRVAGGTGGEEEVFPPLGRCQGEI